MMKKVQMHISAVIKGILFIGFTIQILLGTVWMCGQFLEIQDFGEPDSALYRGIFRLVGENCQIMYLLQLAFAFYAGYRFLGLLCPKKEGNSLRFRRLFLMWGSLALLTFPFALQCHLAIQPHSLMGTLFLLLLSFLVELIARPQHFPKGRKGGMRKAGFLIGAILCIGFVTVLSGVTDRRPGEVKPSLASAMASRLAWPEAWSVTQDWPEGMIEIVGDKAWESSLSVNNGKTLLAEIEEQVGREKLEEYCWQLAKIGWKYYSFEVRHRIAWDILGYAITPLVFQRYVDGSFFDSYTGRNYEVMRAHMPVFTRHYLEYSCWWFGYGLFLAAGLTVLRILTEEISLPKREVLSATICILAAVVLVLLFTMRGAGMMDYKCTIAVNELWLIWTLSRMRVGSNDKESA